MALERSLVHAVDRDGRMDLSHFQSQPNIQFHQLDLYSDNAARLAEEAAAEARRRGSAVLFVGTHLCGNLSPRLVDLFRGVEGPAALVLAPCCLDKKRVVLKNAARRLCVDPHRYWAMSLLLSLPCASPDRRELLIDDNVLSDRNTYVLAAKLT